MIHFDSFSAAAFHFVRPSVVEESETVVASSYYHSGSFFVVAMHQARSVSAVALETAAVSGFHAPSCLRFDSFSAAVLEPLRLASHEELGIDVAFDLLALSCLRHDSFSAAAFGVGSVVASSRTFVAVAAVAFEATQWVAAVLASPLSEKHRAGVARSLRLD